MNLNNEDYYSCILYTYNLLLLILDSDAENMKYKMRSHTPRAYSID